VKSARASCCLAVAAASLLAQTGRDAAELLRMADEKKRADQVSARDRATKLYREALLLLRDDAAGTARVSMELGSLAAARGDLLESRTWFEKAVAAYRTAGLPEGEASALNQLGSSLLTLGQIDAAMDLYSQARQVWNRTGNPRGVAQTHANEALAMRHAGEPQRSLESNRKATELSRAAGDERGEALALHNTAEVLVDIGDFDEALRIAELALRLHRRVGPVGGEIHTMIHLAEAWFGKGDLARARSYLDAAVARARHAGAPLMEAYILRETARVHAAMNQTAQAAARYEQALGLLPADGFPRMEAEIRLRLGQVRRSLGRTDQAAVEWTRALALSREVGNSLLEAETLAGLASLDRDAGRLQQATDAAALATNLIEGQRAKLASAAQRATYMAVRRELYSVEAGILLRQQRLDAAFEVSERAHARALLDLVSLPGQGVVAGVQVTPSSLERLRSGMDDDTLVLEYLLGDTESFVFVLDRRSLRAVRLPPRAGIEEAVRSMRAAMAQPGLRAFARFVVASTACHRILIKPIGDLPSGKTRLIVAPDGILHTLPFEALASGPAQSFAELPYLLKSHAVSYTPSLAVLTRPRPEAPAGGLDLVAIARTKAAPGLAALPHAEREAHAAAGTFRKDRALVLTGDLATEAALRRSEVRLARRLHFATHAIAHDQPGKSGLALGAASPGAEGFIEADEVSRLDLAASLVVLSGCETALGRQLAGEGALGLTRAFHVAGVPAVVSSLWRVADQSSADLMVAFYRRLGSGPAAALREAKLHMLRRPEWTHPYYWASFVLSGR
jgi:CHAT domain-containing protein